MATLSNQSREKLALAVFAGLIVLSLCGFGWYLMAGHSWNVAASTIDDTFGSMEGYTAIVYAGVDHPKPVDALDGSVGGEVGGEDEGPVASGPSSAGDGPGEAAGSADPDDGSASGSGTSSDYRVGGASSAGAGASSGAAAPSVGSKALGKPVTVAEAKESYEEKGATVFSLDTVAPERYADGTILKKGEHRFGVFSVLEPTPVRLVERQVAYFAEHKVDFVVVVTSDKRFVEGAEGIDIVLSTLDEELFVMGETQNGTFFVDAPDEGSVGAILISPSNVVSAKVISEL